MALVGGSALDAPAAVVDYVKARRGAPVRVRLGTLATGTIAAHADSKGLHTKTTQSLPLLHPMLAPLRESGIEPVLAIDIGAEGVEAYASVRIGGALLNRRTMSDALGKHGALIGLRGLDSLSLPIAVNKLDGPTLTLAIDGLRFRVGGFLEGRGTMSLHNETVIFDATATGTVPGLAAITVPIKRDADGSLSGKVKVALSIKGFGGELEASFAHGVVDVVGTVRYANEKFDGMVTIAATDKETAKTLATAHTPAEIKAVAPAAEGAKPHDGAAVHAAKRGDRVLVGWGTVNVRLADWLSGEASVLVDADADVTIVGKITPRMNGPLFPPRDYKHQLAKVEVRAIYGVPVVGNVFVFANVGLEALAKFGPATLTNLEITGRWSTKPTTLQTFGLTGTLNISAFAGLRLVAEGGAGLQVLDHDIKIGVALSALAGVRGYVDVTPRIGYREVADPQLGKKGEFFLGGHLDIAAQPLLQLGGDLFVDLDSPWWSLAPDKRWTWPLAQLEYPLPGEFGIGADVEYVLGSGKTPDIRFTPVAFDASRFMTDLVNDHVPPRKIPPADKKGTWTEPGSKTATGPAGAPPEVNAHPTKPTTPNTGAGIKTPADHAQTPKPENAAMVQKAMSGHADIMKKEQNHPENEVEIAEIVARLKALGFATVAAESTATEWILTASINPASKSRLKKAPPQIYRAPILTTATSGRRGEHVAGEVGVSQYLKPTGEPPAWQVLAGKGVYWVRAHLLDGHLAGPGDAWNLAVVPTGVNTRLHTRYELALKEKTPLGHRYHVDITVYYWDRTGDNSEVELNLKKRNKDFDITEFPRNIFVKYKKISAPPETFPPVDEPVRLPHEWELERNP